MRLSPLCAWLLLDPPATFMAAQALSAWAHSTESDHIMAGTSKKKRAHRTSSAVADASQNYDDVRVHVDEQTVKWRFHRSVDRRWRWQKIAADQTVIESRESFASYSECIADAAGEGYQPLPSTAGLREPM
jgi:hypothetical protein